MKRVVIMGCPGSGKTTLALKLARILNLPTVHLDREHNMPYPGARNKHSNWNERHAALIADEKWIMDGLYYQTAGERIRRADLIIWFELPIFVCLFRVIKRTIMNYGQNRIDTAPGYPIRFDIALYILVLKFRHFKSPKFKQFIAQRHSATKLEIIKTNADLERVILAASQ